MNLKGLPVARACKAVLCGVVLVHVSLAPTSSLQPLPSSRTVVARSTEEGPQEAALKHPDGLLLTAAMQATSRARLRHLEAWLPAQDACQTARFAAWRHGASFARTYTPPRLRRLFAPPSTSDPEA